MIILTALLFARSLVLLFLARILSIILSVLNLFAVWIVYVKVKGFWKVTQEYYFQNALWLDIASHYNHRAFWNLTSSKGGTAFGHNKEKRNETLSSMFGRKKQERTLIGLGWLMYYFLYIIDYKNWKNQGHCINAFESYKNKPTPENKSMKSDNLGGIGGVKGDKK